MPAVGIVRGAVQAQLVLVAPARRERLLPALEHAAEILRMDDRCPAVLDELAEGEIEVVECALVDVVELAARQRRPDLVRLGLGEEAVALLAFAPQLRELLLLQQLRLPL